MITIDKKLISDLFVQAAANGRLRQNFDLGTSTEEGCQRMLNALLPGTQVIVLKRGVPKNFCYGTRLISLLVQALKALKKENVGEEELNIIQQLVLKETDKEALVKDVDMMPAWMKRIIKPMLTT